jgi:hypothetical protein
MVRMVSMVRMVRLVSMVSKVSMINMVSAVSRVRMRRGWYVGSVRRNDPPRLIVILPPLSVQWVQYSTVDPTSSVVCM